MPDTNIPTPWSFGLTLNRVDSPCGCQEPAPYVDPYAPDCVGALTFSPCPPPNNDCVAAPVALARLSPPSSYAQQLVDSINRLLRLIPGGASAIGCKLKPGTPIIMQAADGSFTVTASATGNNGPVQYSLDKISWQTSGKFTGITKVGLVIYLREQYNPDSCTSALFAQLSMGCITPPLPVVSVTDGTATTGQVRLTGQPGNTEAHWYTTADGSGNYTMTPPAYTAVVLAGSVQYCRPGVAGCCSALATFTTNPTAVIPVTPCAITNASHSVAACGLPTTLLTYGFSVALAGDYTVDIYKLSSQVVVATKTHTAARAGSQSGTLPIPLAGLLLGTTLIMRVTSLQTATCLLDDTVNTITIPEVWTNTGPVYRKAGQTACVQEQTGSCFGTFRAIQIDCTDRTPLPIATGWPVMSATLVDLQSFLTANNYGQPPTLGTALANAVTSVGAAYNSTIPDAAFAVGSTTIKSVAVDGLPGGLTYDAATRKISGTATTAGASTITVTASDQNGLTVKTTFTLTVGAKVNQPPVFAGTLTSLPGATAGTLYGYDLPAGTFTDPDNNALVYSATGLPAGLTIDAATGKISGTPTGTATATATVVITATDPSGLSANSGNLSLVVTYTAPPVVSQTTIVEIDEEQINEQNAKSQNYYLKLSADEPAERRIKTKQSAGSPYSNYSTWADCTPVIGNEFSQLYHLFNTNGLEVTIQFRPKSNQTDAATITVVTPASTALTARHQVYPAPINTSYQADGNDIYTA